MAIFQGVIFLILAGSAPDPYNPVLIRTLVCPGRRGWSHAARCFQPSQLSRSLRQGARSQHYPGGRLVPPWLLLQIVAVMGLGLAAIAIAEFRKTE
jgi:hypothetical protein